MDRFRFSANSARTLDQILGNATQAVRPHIEDVVCDIQRFRAQYQPPEDPTRAATVRDDLDDLQRDLKKLIETIDVISRRGVTKTYLEGNGHLYDLMNISGRSAWSELRAAREQAAEALNRVTAKLGPTARRAIPKRRGRPRLSDARLELAVEVATILRAAGIAVAKTRGGPFDQTLKVVFAATEGATPPADLMREVLIPACDQMADLSVEDCERYVRERSRRREALQTRS